MAKALYRKHRPLGFDEVVGQRHITDVLKNQAASGRLSHAYLFTGTHGTGKTTCAKILARAANCENLIEGSPCGCCPSCRAILNDSVPEVLEIDAASNNGVDNIRALQEDVLYPPMSVRRRVFIIDEVHMLSSGAFNALLKTLEEPPEHVMFILATTELHKVPATILSRCQRFAFKRLTTTEIAGRLMQVAQSENISLTSDAAGCIAALSSGAMRDGLTILEQAAAVSEGELTRTEIMRVVGLAGSEQVIDLAGAVCSMDTAACLNILSSLYDAGQDMRGLINQLSGIYRDMLVLKLAGKAGESLVSGLYDINSLTELGSRFDKDRLLAGIDTLSKSAERMPRSADRRTEAEFCLLSLCMTPVFAAVSAPIQAPAARPAAASAAVPVPQPKKEPEAPKPAESAPPPAAAPAQGDLLAKLISICSSRLSLAHRPVFGAASGYSLEGEKLTVYFENEMYATLLSMGDTPGIVEAAAKDLIGQAVHLKFAKKPERTERHEGIERLRGLSDKYDIKIN